jgi:hypothetical protein
MDKNIIKKHLNLTFLSEETVPGISVTASAKKESGKINKDGVKSIEKDVAAFEKNIKADKDAKGMAQNKFNYDDDFEKTYHDEMEIMNGQEMLQYDSKPNDTFKKRAEEGMSGSAQMGNEGGIGNAEAAWGASSDDFGKNLVKRVKSSSKKRNEETPTLRLRGANIQADMKDTGNRPYALSENNKDNNKPQIKEGMKRLKFKKEFNGVGNALKMIPESYRVDNKQFEMTDGNETYKIRWEGNLTEGRAVVLMASDKRMVNEDMAHMKHLMGYKSQETLGTVKGKARLDENAAFTDIWAKTRDLMEGEGNNFKWVWDKSKLTRTQYNNGKQHSSQKFKTLEDLLANKEKADEVQKRREEKGRDKIEHVLKEGEDIESVKAKTGNLEDIKKKAPEASKHIQGSVSKDKGTQAPSAKEGDLDDAVSHAPEAKKHVEGSVSTEKGTKAPAPKKGEWEAVKKKAAEATKHVTMKESFQAEEEEEEEEGVEDVATKEVKTEGENIEGKKVKAGHWEDISVPHAAEAKKHIHMGKESTAKVETEAKEEAITESVTINGITFEPINESWMEEGMYEEGMYEEEMNGEEMGGEENVGELVADKLQDVLSPEELSFLAQAYTKGGKEMVASAIEGTSNESVNEDSNTEPPVEGEFGMSRNEIKLRQILDKVIKTGALGSLAGLLPAAMMGHPFLALGLGVASLVGCGLKDAAWWKGKATNGEEYPHHHGAQNKYGVK